MYVGYLLISFVCAAYVGRSLSAVAAREHAVAGQRASYERPCASDPAVPSLALGGGSAFDNDDDGRPEASGSGGSGPLGEASARLLYDNPAFAASSSSHGSGGIGGVSDSIGFHAQSRAPIPDIKGKGKAVLVTGAHHQQHEP